MYHKDFVDFDLDIDLFWPPLWRRIAYSNRHSHWVSSVGPHSTMTWYSPIRVQEISMNTISSTAKRTLRHANSLNQSWNYGSVPSIYWRCLTTLTLDENVSQTLFYKIRANNGKARFINRGPHAGLSATFRAMRLLSRIFAPQILKLGRHLGKGERRESPLSPNWLDFWWSVKQAFNLARVRTDKHRGGAQRRPPQCGCSYFQRSSGNRFE